MKVIALEHHPHDSRVKIAEDGICQTLNQRMGTGGNNVPLIIAIHEADGQDVTMMEETAYALVSGGGKPGQGYPCILEVYGTDDIQSDKLEEGVKVRVFIADSSGDGAAVTLDSNYYKGQGIRQGVEREFIVEGQTKGITDAEGEIMETIARRLTPIECARLQGYPDDWCEIGEWTDSKGKLHKDADSPKYKALGNSIAVGYANNQSGFWMWLMKRISAQYERSATLGSLFDGIGGFPLAWARYNGAENCRWASEIEEFPMAVTRKHFGDEDAGIEGDIKKYL